MKNKFFDFEIDGINFADAHDFSDAYISGAYTEENGKIREATEEELEELSEDRDLVYELVLEAIY